MNAEEHEHAMDELFSSFHSTHVAIRERRGVDSVAYLRARVAQVFDSAGRNRQRWTVTDAHAVRDVLDELRKRRGLR